MLAQHVQRVPERRSRVTRVEPGPERGDEHVASMPGTRPRRAEIREQRETLGLAQQLVELSAVAPNETNCAERLQDHHAPKRWGACVAGGKGQRATTRS